MKRFLPTLFMTCMIFTASAQDARLDVAKKFMKFYNAKQADSVYSLFSETVQKSIDLNGTRGMIDQLQSQLGAAVSVSADAAPGQERSSFLLSFEKPVTGLALIIGVKIEGIRPKALPRAGVDSVAIKSPDNISITNTYGKVYGSLMLPSAPGKCPVVLLIAGSGPTDRNMNAPQGLQTNSFLLLAESLAKNGIASVRYDKRSIGKSASTQKQSEVSLEDFIQDAEAFIVLLKGDKRFSEVIVAGHSEGAGIGLVAAINQKPKSFISISGISDNLGVTLRKQLSARLPPADLSQANEALDSLQMGKHYTKPLSPILSGSGLFSKNIQPFLISSMKYNFAAQAAKIRIPMLIINGTSDIQVDVENAKKLAAANPKAQLALIPGMNHTLKNVSASVDLQASSYTNPALPLDPQLLSVILKFIKRN